jgi:hypothetical protein
LKVFLVHSVRKTLKNFCTFVIFCPWNFVGLQERKKFEIYFQFFKWRSKV